MSQTIKKNVMIIGAGAAGLMAAICVAKTGADVALIEHNSRVGKKILSTGNGRCNLTNENPTEKSYRGSDPAFAERVISHFDITRTLSFFEELGVYTVSKDGLIYPRTNQAQTVLDCLRIALIEQGDTECVTVINDARITDLSHGDAGFLANVVVDEKMNSKTIQVRSDALILSTGGLAAPKTGSDGSGYAYAKIFGHSLVPTVPALCALSASSPFLKALHGVRTAANCALYIDGNNVYEEKGELQFTKTSLSGIVVFQFSRYAAYALKDNHSVVVKIDLTPEIMKNDLEKELFRRKMTFPERSAEELLLGILQKKLAIELCKLCNIRPSAPAGSVSTDTIKKLALQIKGLCVPITGTASFEAAQTTAGGISVKEIDPDTMGSKLVKGLFFAGEIVDIDGACGGFNLQWAWSSGAVSGICAAIHSLSKASQ